VIVHRINLILTFLALLLPAVGSRCAETPPEIFLGKPFSIHLSFETDMAMVDENGVCSFKPAGQGKPLRFKFVPGVANTNLVSLESVERPGCYLRHFFTRLKVDLVPEKAIFAPDATFEVRPSPTGNGLRLRSFNYRDCYIGATHSKKAFIIPDPAPESVALDIVY
jgi:hypothetical protein